MRYELKTISIHAISVEDRTFIITTARNIELLQQSLERVGLLCPPYLYFDSARQQYQIVCGSRRVRACITAGWEEISAYVIEEGSAAGELFLLSLYDNLSHRVLDPAEKARAALKLLACYAADTVVREHLPLLGLPPTEKTLAHLLSLARLEPAIQDAVALGSLCESAAAKLAPLEEHDRKALFELFSQTHCSASKQEEIISHCMDIGLRDGAGCSAILEERAIQEIIAQDTLTLSQKADRVRAHLRRRRFPRLSQHEEKFLRQRKKLRLPPGVQLLPPPFFEGGRFRIEIEFDYAGDLKQKAAAVMSMADSRLLQDIVETA